MSSWEFKRKDRRVEPEKDEHAMYRIFGTEKSLSYMESGK
jgi:hypothetical protein